MRWWIIEDAAFIRVILRQQLQKFFGEHLEICEWSDATRLISSINEKTPAPDGIICDVVLPSQSGLSLLPIFSSQWPDSFVFLISSLSEESWQTHLPSSARYHAFLQKPLGLESFQEILSQFQEYRRQINKGVA